MAKKVYQEKTATDVKTIKNIVDALEKDKTKVLSCETYKDIDILLKSAVDKLDIYKTLGTIVPLSSDKLDLSDIRKAVKDFNKSVFDVIRRNVQTRGILVTLNEVTALSNKSEVALSVSSLKITLNKSNLFNVSVSLYPIAQNDFINVVCSAKDITEVKKVEISTVIATNFEKFSKNIGNINPSNNTKVLKDETDETKDTNTKTKLIHDFVVSELLKNGSFTSVTNVCKVFNEYINNVIVHLAEIDGIELKKNFKSQKYGIVITRKLVDAVLKPDKMESTRNRVLYPNNKIISNCWGMALVGLHMALTSIYKNTANKNNAENQLELIQTNATATTSEILQAPQVSEIVLVKA